MTPILVGTRSTLSAHLEKFVISPIGRLRVWARVALPHSWRRQCMGNLKVAERVIQCCQRTVFALYSLYTCTLISEN